MKTFLIGNIVRWRNSFWIVASKEKHDKLGEHYKLLSLSSSNCSTGVYEFPSDPDWHIDEAEVVASCVYDFIEMGMLRFLDDLGKHEKK